MRNILNLQLGTIVSGKEINEWVWDQIANHKNNHKEANRFLNHFIIRDSGQYKIVRMVLPSVPKESIGFIKIN